MSSEAPPSLADAHHFFHVCRLGGGEDLDQFGDDCTGQGPHADDDGEHPPIVGMRLAHLSATPDQKVGHHEGEDDGDDRGDPDQRRKGRLEVHLVGVLVTGLRHGGVEEVRTAARDDHHHAHGEDPHQKRNLDGRLLNGEDDEGDEGHAGDAVGLEAVGAGTDGVAGVVAGAVCDHARVAGVVFFDVEDDLHEVGADVGDLGEDTARDPQGGSTQRLADGESR